MSAPVATDRSIQDRLRDLEIEMIPLPTPFPVGPVNVFVFKTDPPVLVDTGLKSEESQRLLESRLAEHGYAFSDLGHIIVTHGHRDHMGLLGELQRISRAKTYSHPHVARHGEADPDSGDSRKQFYIDILFEFGVPNEITGQANSLYDRFRTLAEPFVIDEVLVDGGHTAGYDIHFVPGHSPSDTLFVNTARGFSIVGDHILTNTNPNPLLRRPEGEQPRAKSLVEYRASLQKSRKLDLGLCLPGHGEPFLDHIPVIDRILSRQDKRSEQVLKLVQEGETTPYRVSKRLFPDLPLPNLHMGLSIAVGHLELLEGEGELASTHHGGILSFDKIG